MNIVLVSYMDFTGPGVIHMFHFANGLVRLGHRVLFLVNGDADSVRTMEEKPLFRIVQVRFKGFELHPSVIKDVERFCPHIVHIWTPRNLPARVGLELKFRFQIRMIIHYEDDEDVLIRQNDFQYFRFLTYAIDSFRNPIKWVWAHPFTYHWVNVYADALTVISPDYARALQARWRIPTTLLIPGVDLERFSPKVQRDETLATHLGCRDRVVLLYGGSIAQFYEFDTILEAMRLLKESHPQLVVLQYGRNFMADRISAFLREHQLEDRFIFCGQIAHHDVIRYLSLGDIYLQPGQNTVFNRHRLPSKIPEYMAMGRPVITFSCGIGEEFEHMTHAWKLTEGTPDALANAIAAVVDGQKLRETLAGGARRRAEEIFSWSRSVERLDSWYRVVLLNPHRLRAEDVVSEPSTLIDDVIQTFRSTEECVGEDVRDVAASSLWDEVLALREFHRKVTSTLLYRIYFQLKLALAAIRKAFANDQDTPACR